MRIPALFGLAAAVLLAACTGDGDTVVAGATVPADTPNSFLTFPNTQASLAAGDYQIVVGTAAVGAGAGQPYTLTITRADGSVQSIEGNWPAGSSGPSATAAGNVAHDFALDQAGGATFSLASAVEGHLFLTRNGVVVASASANDGNGSVVIDMPVTPISSVEYAQAYYRAVDPLGLRETLAEWKERNGFNDSGNPDITITHVTFRDALDLGYGRDMYVLRERSAGVTRRIAFYVNNYVVQLQPGSSSNYGPLNVDAAISGDARFFRGSNAIEFSPADEDAPNANGDMKITKFFTFDKAGKRLTSADLDGRGVKHMPGMCWACHGGQTMPLDENGGFQAQSLRSAKYNILGAGEFEYSLIPGWSRADQEARLRTLNSYVMESYADLDARPDANGDRGQGKWSAHYALELVNGRYGDNDDDGVSSGNFASGTYQDDFVPFGWRQENNPTAGVDTETLFRRVVGPHCTACHSLQGREAAVLTSADPSQPNLPGNLGLAINFSSFEKFYAYRSRIADYVFRRGIMPLGLRNWERFWKDANGAPAILASALGDSSLFAGGAVIQPGLPVARPGVERTVKSPVQLDGSASYFAQSYRWEIVSVAPADTLIAPAAALAAASLSNATTARAALIAPEDGDYVLRLTVTNSRGSHSETVTHTVSSSTTDQTRLTFVDDIRPIFTAKDCVDCHQLDAPGRAGIPVSWSEADVVDSNGIRLYQRVMERVDLRDPENSRLLQRPTSLTHGGGLKLNLTSPTDRAYYNTILNWIREGAVCGTGTVYGCPE
ncbi:MAG: hypothetical protein ACOY41_00655 [Pseudomonadota bacterium]